MTSVARNHSQPLSHLTALFETRPEAERARADLLAAGFADANVALLEGAEAMVAAKPPRHENIVMTLLNIFVFMPKDDRSTAEEAMRRGAVAVTIRASEQDYERAINILDRDGAIDLDERQLAWRDETSGHRAAPSPPGVYLGARPGFEGREALDPLDDPHANPDVRERIGTGTADMMVGLDPAPSHAASDRGTESSGETDAAAMLRRDPRPGRRRVRSYVGSAEAMPSGVDPQI